LEEFLSANGLDLIKSQLIKLDFDLTTLSNMGDDILSIPNLNLGTKYKLISAIKKKNGKASIDLVLVLIVCFIAFLTS
jgi:hypothetical protein